MYCGSDAKSSDSPTTSMSSSLSENLPPMPLLAVPVFAVAFGSLTAVPPYLPSALYRIGHSTILSSGSPTKSRRRHKCFRNRKHAFLSPPDRSSRVRRNDDVRTLAFHNDFLFDGRVFALALYEASSKAQVFEFQSADLGLYLLDIDRAVHELEVLQDRMRSRERFNEQRVC